MRLIVCLRFIGRPIIGSRFSRCTARDTGAMAPQPLRYREAPLGATPDSTKTVSQNRPVETAASKPLESSKSVNGDWLRPAK